MSTGGETSETPLLRSAVHSDARHAMQGSLRGVIDFDLDRDFMIPSSSLSPTTWEDDFNTSHIGVAVSCY